MKKVIAFVLGSFVAANLGMTVAHAAADEVRVAFSWSGQLQTKKIKLKMLLIQLWVFQLNGRTLLQVGR